MLIDHARQLKAVLLGNLLTEIASAAVVRTLAIRAQAMSAESEAIRSIAVGIAESRNGYQFNWQCEFSAVHC